MHHAIEIGPVEGMASEGQGIVRHEGRVTFIPFTAIGDTVRYRIDHHKKNFATATLIDILKPSPDRVSPPCPYYGTCGGCQLQHVNYEAQLRYKRMWIENALRKIGGLQNITIPPVVPSTSQWGYRRRVSLQLVPQNGSYRAGYISMDNRSLLTVETCPIFTDRKETVLQVLNAMAAKFHPSGDDKAKATVLKCDGDHYILHFHFKKLPENCSDVLSRSLASHKILKGVLATSPRKALSYGEIETKAEIEGLRINFSPRTFIQTHPEQSLNIYRLVEQYARKTGARSVVDLYCGIGITTLLAARLGGNAIGIELNAQSIAHAKTNAKDNGISNVAFEVADAAIALPALLKNHVPDLVIVNPPREGVSPDVLKALCSSKIKSMIYISCMPSTLARDLKELCRNGYKISSVTPFDMFPQTVHVETVVTLEA